MVTTPNLGIQLIETNQSQKEVTANEAFQAIDAAFGSPAINNNQTGEYRRIERAEISETGLSGASVITGLVLPDRAVIEAVMCRVTEEITGATGFEVGITGETGLFGSGIGVVVDSTNVGVITPRPIFANTNVILAAIGDTFAGGAVDIIAHYRTHRGNWDF